MKEGAGCCRCPQPWPARCVSAVNEPARCCSKDMKGGHMPAFDAIVIGTGQAGPSLAHRLTKAGMRVAVIERQRFGGTCVNTGCTPTKTLVASAYAAHLARRADEFGVAIEGGVRVDMQKVKQRKDYVLGFSERGVERRLRDNPNIVVYHDHAHFVSPSTVMVGSETLTAPKIFINVGGRASIPDVPGLAEVGYLTNSSLLDLDELPPHLIVLGGSYVGLEFAQAFRRFGSQVTVIEAAPRLIVREDADTSEAVAEILAGEGIDLMLAAKEVEAGKCGNDTVVSIETDGGGNEVVGSHLLSAVGHRPNANDQALDKAGVTIDPRGYISVDEELRSNVPGIWALGDCNCKGAFTH